MKRMNERGFGIIEAMLIVVAVGILGFVCWYVYDANKKSESTSSVSSTSQEAKTTEQQKTSSTKLDKEYKDDAGSFTVNYPSNWKVLTKKSNAALGDMTSTTLTSSTGTILNLNTDYGGKGGACEPNKDDKPFQLGNKCSTHQYLTFESVNIGNMYKSGTEFAAKAQLQTVRYQQSDGGDKYIIRLADVCDFDVCELNKPYMGLFYESSGVVNYVKGKDYQPYIHAYASGGDEDFLKSPDANIIKDILRSLRVN